MEEKLKDFYQSVEGFLKRYHPGEIAVMYEASGGIDLRLFDTRGNVEARFSLEDFVVHLSTNFLIKGIPFVEEEVGGKDKEIKIRDSKQIHLSDAQYRKLIQDGSSWSFISKTYVSHEKKAWRRGRC